MIKGAIFDVDGVLLDSMSIWKDLGARYLRDIGSEPEPALGDILFSMSMEEGAAYLRKTYGLTFGEDEILRDLKHMLEDFYFNEVRLKPGAREVLEFLDGRGILMVLATSSPREHVSRALGRNGVMHYFKDRLLTTEEVGKSKHYPDIFERAAELIGSEPGETLVFEDSLYALSTASDAGFITAGVYDATGEKNHEEMKKKATIYLKDLSGSEELWNVINS